jgi:hypothetical protein
VRCTAVRFVWHFVRTLGQYFTVGVPLPLTYSRFTIPNKRRCTPRAILLLCDLAPPGRGPVPNKSPQQVTPTSHPNKSPQQVTPTSHQVPTCFIKSNAFTVRLSDSTTLFGTPSLEYSNDFTVNAALSNKTESPLNKTNPSESLTGSS